MVSNNNGVQSLSPLAKFIKDFSVEGPILYGMFSIIIALVLGAGAAVIRSLFSNLRKKGLAK